MENRATKSGIARDVQQKIAGKYDQQAAATVMGWLARHTGEPLDTTGDMDSVYQQLKDGYVLLKMAAKLELRGVKAPTKRQTMAFKAMQDINNFLTAIKGAPMNVPDSCCFATADLWENQNMVQVVTCLESVGRVLGKCGIAGIDSVGPKMAEKNERNFTQEQLAEGKNVIGLQMGSNKGATQAGQNFGKGRMIVD